MDSSHAILPQNENCCPRHQRQSETNKIVWLHTGCDETVSDEFSRDKNKRDDFLFQAVSGNSGNISHSDAIWPVMKK